MNHSNLKWIDPLPVEIPNDLQDFFQESPFLVEALVRRGITTPEQARSFLDPLVYRPSDPFDLPDMDVAVARLDKATDHNETVAVWGDFDVDGQTSTALLVQSLRRLGGKVVYHIPVREHESHGINIPQLKLLIEQGASLLLTCDTGSSAQEAIQYAQDMGMDVLITDHHLLPEKKPGAKALVSPQLLPSGHPAAGLCGVGVAWKLSEALHKQRGRSSEFERDLDLAALGTIADMASLMDDNRYLVQRGLAMMRSDPRPAIKAMLEAAGIQQQFLNENHLAFTIAPRLNALGRLADANPVVDFLLTRDDLQAHSFSSQLELLNGQRKQMCDQVFQAVQNHLDQHPEILKEPILVLDHPSWPASILGITASRLVEIYSRPAILICAPPGKLAQGSARSIEGFDITAAITTQQSILRGYGGHPMAAGLSLESENIPTFRKAINETAARTLDVEGQKKDLIVDLWLPLRALDIDLANTLEQLAPYGMGNPPFTLASHNLLIKEVAQIGRTRDHLKVAVEDQQGEGRKVLFWHGADSALPEGLFDLAFQASTTNYLGKVEVSLEWIASRPSEHRSSIDIQPSIEVIDLRDSDNPIGAIQPYLSRDDVIIWKEGDPDSPHTGVDRYHLRESSCLIIWTSPPGLSELKSAIQLVCPRTLVIVSTPILYTEVNTFLVQLSGLLKYALTHQKDTSIKELAGRLAHKEATILQGILWFQASGMLDCQVSQGGMLKVKPGTTLKSKQHPEDTLPLKHLLRETAAFRTHFIKTDLNYLIDKTLTGQDNPK